MTCHVSKVAKTGNILEVTGLFDEQDSEVTEQIMQQYYKNCASKCEWHLSGGLPLDKALQLAPALA